MSRFKDDIPDDWKPPSAPFQSHSPTSKQAATEIEPHLGRAQRCVYDCIRSMGADGATDDELIVAMPRYSPSTIRPRRIELEQRGLIVNSGRERLTRSNRRAVVWIAKST